MSRIASIFIKVDSFSDVVAVLWSEAEILTSRVISKDYPGSAGP